MSSGITYCIQTSFDSRLSDRKKPFGSESSVTSFQNSASLSRSGMALDGTTGAGGDGAVGAAVGVGAAGVTLTGGFAHDAGHAAMKSQRSADASRRRQSMCEPLRRMLPENPESL